MPHAATPGPGEGESSTLAPVLPSANSYPEDGPGPSTSASPSGLLRRTGGSSSSSSHAEQGHFLPASRSRPLSTDELRARADTPLSDPGAEVDLRVEQMRIEEGIRTSEEGGVRGKQRLEPPKGWLHFVAGGVGGMCGGIITAPLDVVKTRLQSDLFQQKSKAAAAAQPQARGVLAAGKRLGYHFVETGHLLKEIATKEGPRALFKGLGPTLVGSVPARSINFFTYGNGKIFLAEKLNDGKETPIIHLSAAAMAGIVTATATNPIWVVKTRLQLESHQKEQAARSSRAAAVQRGGVTAAASSSSSRAAFSTSASSHSSQHSSAARPPPRTVGLPSSNNFFRPARSPAAPSTNAFSMALRIVRAEGIKGLYAGMSASYLGVAEGTIQWVLYERLKRAANNADKDSLPGKLLGTVGAAGTAKMTASLITYPHEVVRTRLRQQPRGGKPKYTGLVQTIRLVWKEEGAAALYGGLSAHLMRVVPNAAVMFSIYEIFLRLGAHAQAREREEREAQTSLRPRNESVSSS